MFFVEDLVDFVFDFGKIRHAFFLGLFGAVEVGVELLLYFRDFFLESFPMEIEYDYCDDQNKDDGPEEDCYNIVCRLWDKIRKFHVSSPL